eukprot:Pgem_evm1s3685
MAIGGVIVLVFTICACILLNKILQPYLSLFSCQDLEKGQTMGYETKDNGSVDSIDLDDSSSIGENDDIKKHNTINDKNFKQQQQQQQQTLPPVSRKTSKINFHFPSFKKIKDCSHSHFEEVKASDFDEDENNENSNNDNINNNNNTNNNDNNNNNNNNNNNSSNNNTNNNDNNNNNDKKNTDDSTNSNNDIIENVLKQSHSFPIMNNNNNSHNITNIVENNYLNGNVPGMRKPSKVTVFALNNEFESQTYTSNSSINSSRLSTSSSSASSFFPRKTSKISFKHFPSLKKSKSESHFEIVKPPSFEQDDENDDDNDNDDNDNDDNGDDNDNDNDNDDDNYFKQKPISKHTSASCVSPTTSKNKITFHFPSLRNPSNKGNKGNCFQEVKASDFETNSD